MVHSVLVAPFSSAEEANIAFNSLRVDPELRKSLVSKQLSVDQNQLIAYVYACMYGKFYVFVLYAYLHNYVYTYHKWGNFRWAKLLWYPHYKDFRGYTFAVQGQGTCF